MRALVVGWYGHHNLGDEAFRPAIQKLLGVECEFTDVVPADVNDNYDVLVFGGGSFLDQPIKSAVAAEDVRIPTAFVGVGIHWVHPDNKVWLERARVIVSRNQADLEGVLVGPDLLFSRQTVPDSGTETYVPELVRVSEPRRRLLVLPNSFMVPNSSTPAWKVRAADAFELAMTETITRYRNQGWEVAIVPMLATLGPVTEPHDDRVAGLRLMTMSDTSHISAYCMGIHERSLFWEVDRADLIISCRFHGCVLATMAGVPFVGIGGHDKFKSYFDDLRWSNYLSFYGYTADGLTPALESCPSPDEMHHTTERGRARWADLQDIVRDRLFS